MNDDHPLIGKPGHLYRRWARALELAELAAERIEYKMAATLLADPDASPADRAYARARLAAMTEFSAHRHARVAQQMARMHLLLASRLWQS
jgi:hypothetical protein